VSPSVLLQSASVTLPGCCQQLIKVGFAFNAARESPRELCLSGLGAHEALPVTAQCRTFAVSRFRARTSSAVCTDLQVCPARPWHDTCRQAVQPTCIDYSTLYQSVFGRVSTLLCCLHQLHQLRQLHVVRKLQQAQTVNCSTLELHFWPDVGTGFYV